jgi:cytoskeletal protein CcmA (bactofilin family)
MFRRKDTKPLSTAPPVPAERVTSVLGSGTIWKGSLSGSGGVRIEGAFEGEISLRGILVIGATGRVTCPHLRANTVIIAGAVQGDITAEKVEIRASGRVWGDVVTAAFSTEEGAFLRGQIRMEEKVDIGAAAPRKDELIGASETAPAEGIETAPADETLSSVVEPLSDSETLEETVQTMPAHEEPVEQGPTTGISNEEEDERQSPYQEPEVESSDQGGNGPTVEQPHKDLPATTDERAEFLE